VGLVAVVTDVADNNNVSVAVGVDAVFDDADVEVAVATGVTGLAT